MVTKVERKGRPISTRLPEVDIAIIDRAAGLRAAEDVLMENRLIRMSPDGFACFMDALSGPAEPVPEIAELDRRPAPKGVGLPGAGLNPWRCPRRCG
jgi:uncharacterized protein (DUF1778 family)